MPLNNFFLPPLHIKQNKNGRGIQYLKTKCPKISNAKLKEGIFLDSKIRELVTDGTFNSKLNRADKSAWAALIELCHN